MKHWQKTGLFLEAMVLAGVIASFFLSRILGYILIILWLFIGGPLYIAFMFMDDDDENEHTPVAHDRTPSPCTAMIGHVVETLSELKPYGYISVNDKRISAKSILGFIPSGVLVEIKDVENDSVIVEEIKGHNHGLESTSAPPAAGTLETHP